MNGSHRRRTAPVVCDTANAASAGNATSVEADT
jgi:hypothetical protein